MPTLNDTQEKEVLPKPFASIRFVLEPPVELKMQFENIPENTLFIEVIHGNESGVLNKQWVPLFLKPHSNTTTCFDTQTIVNFICRSAETNKYTLFVLATPDVAPDTQLTLCIPILSGECQLAFTPDGSVCINRVPTDLALTIETPGFLKTGADILCRTVYFSAKNIRNNYALMAETIALKTLTTEMQYSFVNTGNIAATQGDFIFTGQGISHKAGTLTAHQNMLITANNIKLWAATVARQNITLHHGGGTWFVKDTVKAEGELSFYFEEGRTITESRNVSGSLKYVLSNSATKPLIFMADQVAESGNICIETPVSLMIGDDKNLVTFKSQSLSLYAKSLIFYNGKLLSVDGMKLKTIEAIILGKIENETLSEETKEKKDIASVAILCHGSVEMHANGISEWTQLEMSCGGNFCLTGDGTLVNTSSQVQVKGNAILNMPTRHQLLVKEEASSAKALTKQATVIIEGKLNIGNNALDIFASHFSCCEFEGTMPILKDKSFTPFTTVTETYKSGEDKKRHVFHRPTVTPLYSTRSKVVLGEPINASFSVGSDVSVSIPHFDFSGIFSAISIEINEIEQGLIGQFEKRVSVAPMVFRPFKDQVSLQNYFEPTSLYEISPGGETVFKSILPLRNIAPFVPQLPRMLLSENGTLSISPFNLRRIFPREKEATLLAKVMLKEFGRGFLNKEANTPQKMMQYLEANTLRYSDRQAANASSMAKLLEPCIVDKIETLVFEDGHSEEVLSSIALFPKHFDNRRLMDGAGCLFALGDVTLTGVPGSEIHVRGNIDAEGLVTYQNIETLTRMRNTHTRYQTIEHQTNRKSLMGKNETTTAYQQVGVTELQPGNEMVAGHGVCYKAVNNIYLSGARDQLGSEGLVVENADVLVDAAIVRNKIGSAVAVQQKGFLGIGGTSTSITPILQEAMGSEIETTGPLYIQARYAQLDATQFKDPEHEEPRLEFEISELHFHELLNAIETQNKANETLLLSELKAQAKTAKRKSRQSTTLLLISLPVSYYTGGLISGYLQSAMGVTISQTVVNGVVVAEATATAAQTAAIVGLSGMGASIASAVIQSQPVAKAAVNGAVFSLIGHGVVKAPVLAKSTQLTRDVASGVAVGGTTALFNHSNIIESALMGGAASGIAAAVVPGLDTSLSMVASAAKTAVRSGVALALNDGTISDLGINLASAAMGASAGRTLSEEGIAHGQRLASEERIIPRIREVRVPPKKQITLNAAHQRMQAILFDTPLQRSFNEIKDNTLKGQPVLLWRAPHRANRREERNWGTRALGGLQALGGSAQIVASLAGALVSAPTVIGPAIATTIATMGADNVMAGLQALWTGESQQTLLFRALNVLGTETNLYGAQGAANIEAVLNLTSCVNPRSLLLGFREFAAERTFRSPILIEYDPNRLYSGLPVDIFKLQKPWAKKDLLSETARLYPSPLLGHEERIIEQWAMERVRLLERWQVQDVSVVNEKMYDLLNKCRTQLRVRMTPDDLAAIVKEQRGLKIPKIEGGSFDHLNNEWRQVQDSFKNAFNGPWSGNIEEARILNERFGDVSRLWDRFETLIERAKCNTEITKLKN